jgi:hypothetical protein
MIKKITAAVAILASMQYAYGQTPAIETEKWADKPTLSSLDSKYSKESAVVLSDKRRIEYIDNKKQDVEEYYTIHKIVHVNDDKGIEAFNKIYLDASDNSEILDIKARTILPGGKIIELDRSNIKDIKEEDGNVYKIFAMEGLEKGCEIEFYYTRKTPVSYFGREILQRNFPVLSADISIIAPDRLKFDVKPYNFTAPVTDTVINSKRITECVEKMIPGAEEEKYASVVANLQRVEYKLSYNESTQKGVRLFTWNELAKRAFGMYTYTTDKENSKIAAMVTANGWDKLSGEVPKIIAVESYVKKNFSYDENPASDDASKLETVLQNKIGSTIGTMRLYSAIFKNLGINFEFVLTGDREKYVIDRTFENWDNCDHPLLYFPAEHKFMAPTRPDFRYPWILPEWGETTGLFCTQTSIGTFSTAIAEVKKVALEDYTQSFDNIESNLSLNSSLDSMNVDVKLSYAGYIANEYRDALNLSNDEQKTKMLKEMAKEFAGSDNLKFSEVLGQDYANENTDEPLTMHFKAATEGLIEQAGNKLLVKIGMAIGPQEEMYQEKPRQDPISIPFGHYEERTLNFIIPAGYTINNPNDLKISQTYSEGGELSMGFVSDYEIKGNVLKVHVMEQYRKTDYPLSVFPDFRRVIDASSDFNKVVLVLEKKSS